MLKHYYRLDFTQNAPLRIGTGFGSVSDSDVAKDNRGLPFIPGSSLAGVLRSAFDCAVANALFGEMKANGTVTESRILISDATLPKNAEARISTRDGVGLNDRGTALKGAKYDFEVVETKAAYTAILELTDVRYAAALAEVLSRWVVFGAQFGARTTRGYGSMSVSVRDRTFDLTKQFADWLDFDPFLPTAFDGIDAWKADDALTAPRDTLCIRATIRVRDSFSVRRNTSNLTDRDDRAAPDSVPTENMHGEPVVPGTAWAGAFRHHIRNTAKVLGKDAAFLHCIDACFGVDQGVKQRSRVLFSETAFSGCKKRDVTRNAIDRFTQAPRNTGLYTTRIAEGGEGELTILLPARTEREVLALFAIALYDLDCGILTFGGERGVGRGVGALTALTINGEDRLDALRSGKTDGLLTSEKEATQHDAE